MSSSVAERVRERAGALRGAGEGGAGQLRSAAGVEAHNKVRDGADALPERLENNKVKDRELRVRLLRPRIL